MRFPSPVVCKHSTCPRCAAFKQSMLPCFFHWELGLSPFGNYWWSRKSRSLTHIHVEGRKAIFIACAWRPDVVWHLSSRTLREPETQKRSNRQFLRGRIGIWEIYHIFYYIWYLIVLCCLLSLAFLWSAQWYHLKNKTTTYKSEKEEALQRICCREMLSAHTHLIEANIFHKKSFL